MSDFRRSSWSSGGFFTPPLLHPYSSSTPPLRHLHFDACSPLGVTILAVVSPLCLSLLRRAPSRTIWFCFWSQALALSSFRLPLVTRCRAAKSRSPGGRREEREGRREKRADRREKREERREKREERREKREERREKRSQKRPPEIPKLTDSRVCWSRKGSKQLGATSMA